MTTRQKNLEFDAFVRRRARQAEPEIGLGKPGRCFRRNVPVGQTAKSFARLVPDGREWLARKAAGR